MDIYKIITRNFWLKMLALLCAVITWFYVVGEIEKQDDSEQQFFYSAFTHKLDSRVIPVKPILVSLPPTGYAVDQKKTAVIPTDVMVIGPSQILENIPYVSTIPINVSERTKSFSVKVELAPIGRLVLPKGTSVEVNVVISKVKGE